MQYNDGFKTNLIGTPQQIAERIVALKNIGVDLILSGFYTLLKRWNISEKSSAARSSVRTSTGKEEVEIQAKSA